MIFFNTRTLSPLDSTGPKPYLQFFDDLMQIYSCCPPQKGWNIMLIQSFYYV